MIKIWSELPVARVKEQVADVATLVWLLFWGNIVWQLFQFLASFAQAGRTIRAGGQSVGPASRAVQHGSFRVLEIRSKRPECGRSRFGRRSELVESARLDQSREARAVGRRQPGAGRSLICTARSAQISSQRKSGSWNLGGYWS